MQKREGEEKNLEEDGSPSLFIHDSHLLVAPNFLRLHQLWKNKIWNIFLFLFLTGPTWKIKNNIKNFSLHRTQKMMLKKSFTYGQAKQFIENGAQEVNTYTHFLSI